MELTIALRNNQQLLSVSWAATDSVSVAYGNGQHADCLALPDLSTAVKLNSFAYIPGVMSVSVPKLAVAILLMRLLNVSKIQRILMYSMCYITNVAQALCAILLFTQCESGSGLWHPEILPVCRDPYVQVQFTFFAGSFSAFVDFYLAFYAIWVLSKLKMDLKKKVGLNLVMGLGICAGAVAVYKCATLPGLADHSDYTYTTANLQIMTSVEPTVIIVAACLPTLRPVFLFFKERASSLSFSRTEGHSESQPKVYPSTKNYQLHSISKRRLDRREKWDFGLENGNDSNELSSGFQDPTVRIYSEQQRDSMEARILPQGEKEGQKIRKTVDIDVTANHDNEGAGRRGRERTIQ
ncbi:MAG: hypothetical protein Q9219_007458 [cf. Caloplaca sp. 3 TL-2023]